MSICTAIIALFADSTAASAATTPGTAPVAPSPATLPQAAQRGETWEGLAVLFFTALAIFLIVKLRVLRAQSIVGPNRRPPSGRLWTIAVAAAMGFCAWQFASITYLATLAGQWKAAGIEDVAHRVTDLLTPKNYAFLATVPPTIAFFVLLACNALFAPGNLTAIGIRLSKFLRGVGIGIVSFLIIGPMMLWGMQILDRVYRAVHYEHPAEHALLKSLGEAKETSYAALLALGAVLVAPLLEELLFRGHLQTFIRQWLAEISARRIGSPLFPPASDSFMGLTPPPPPPPLHPGASIFVDAATPVLPYMSLPLPPPPPPPPPVPRAWHGWVAIIITSICFAAMHEAWTAPAIFVLSLALGYVYERTANLWASITVHLLFNALNTLQFILLMRGGH
jgi:membrane protease YdiL (CAAX protease family)